jgi:medium-chain acyl-[acyl-carrier-protein] hydrolase
MSLRQDWSVWRTPWILSRAPSDTAKLKMFCFPFAGSGASALRFWAGLMPPEIQVCLVQYPGKESRIREDPFRNLRQLADSATEGLLPELQAPFVFFGYSMGALVAFEVSRRLQAMGKAGPQMLITCASPAPQIVRRAEPKYSLPEEQLIHELREMAGTPPEVLDNLELIRLFLPAIRADFEAVETYHYKGKQHSLTCPILTIGGADDPDIEPEKLDGWSLHTRGKFDCHVVPGGHFFLLHNPKPISELVTSHILPLMEAPPKSGLTPEFQPTIL